MVKRDKRKPLAPGESLYYLTPCAFSTRQAAEYMWSCFLLVAIPRKAKSLLFIVTSIAHTVEACSFDTGDHTFATC